MVRPPDDDLTGRAFDTRLLRRLLSYARPHMRGFFFSTLLLLLLAVMTLFVPYLVGQAINDYLVGDPSVATSDDTRTQGVRWTATFLLGIGVATFS